jgi:HD-like signal output (HDOD) protein
MQSANFETLLPKPANAQKAAIRDKLVSVLNSQGEILPSANSPRGKLWHLVNSPESTIDDCEEVILLDTALASRIFKVANSGAYGPKTDNISQAIRRLGLRFIREQVFNAGVFKQYSGWVLPPEWDLFWLRSIFTAKLCERISAKFGATNGSEYLVGLIHDIGWLFLATYVPEEFTQIFNSGVPIGQAEKQFLPFDHAEISSVIALRAELPLRAFNAILYHHDTGLLDLGGSAPQKSPRFLGIILNICDRIADCHQMDMFAPSTRTMEQIQNSPEVQWLGEFGDVSDLATIAQEELERSQQIFEAFFSNRQFT